MEFHCLQDIPGNQQSGMVLLGHPASCQLFKWSIAAAAGDRPAFTSSFGQVGVGDPTGGPLVFHVAESIDDIVVVIDHGRTGRQHLFD